jgi:hypothetical protein
VTLRQIIHGSPAKANELFTKLVETTDGAVKTREKLLADLTEELELAARLEEEHLFPVLRKHKETKGLVSDAVADNKRVRALLAELQQMPKDGEEFRAKVVELRRVFQQHVRDEKKELLPAVQKALSDEEAQAIVERIEADKAEIEEARREEAEQRRAEARREREEAERRRAEEEAAEREARRARAAFTRSAENAAQAGVSVAKAGGTVASLGAEAAARSSHQVAELLERATEQTAASASGLAASWYRGALPLPADLQAFSRLPSAFSEAGEAWMDWIGKTAETGARASRELANCATPYQFVSVQANFFGEAMRAWIEVSARMIEISMSGGTARTRRSDRAAR